MYRIVQEALTNVARHASVKEATADMDDPRFAPCPGRRSWKGFLVERRLPAAPTSSGLWVMGERAVALGGDLIVESVPGVGTLVTLEAPLSGSLARR